MMRHGLHSKRRSIEVRSLVNTLEDETPYLANIDTGHAEVCEYEGCKTAKEGSLSIP